MSTSTFTPGDNKQDEKLNPGQQDADRRFSEIARAEEKGTFDDIANNYDKTADSSAEDANIQKLRNQEALSAPNPGWKNDVTPASEKKKGGGKGWFKKGGPIIGIGGLFGIGGFVLIGLASPSLLIVQMKETMVSKFNTQLASMEVRSNKLLVSKLNGATKGTCGSVISIRCKFSTMSDKQVEKLKKAGIEVVPDEKTSITGRVKPKALKFGDLEISPKDFTKMANTNADFRSALKQAYNPKFAGFVGKAWANVAAHFKTSKKTPELDAAEDKNKARAKMNDVAKEGTADNGRTTLEASDKNCKGDGCITKERADATNTNASELEADAKSGSAASDVRSKLSGISSGSVTNIFKITGAVDNACQVYGAVTTLTYAAKAIRAAQLVRYAMIFFSVADAIKGGASPDPADVALLGDTLTNTIKDPTDPSKTLVGSATDSFGYKYAAYGDSSASKQSMQIANRFTAGGGFVGDMATTTNAVMAFLGGRAGAKGTCGFLANPLVQGASIILGVASLFVPGANLVKIGTQAAVGVGFSFLMAIIPSLLADIVAGTVTSNISGEESGNAMASGAGTLMQDALAGQNGNGPMTKDDALAYNSLQTQTTNDYIADELRTTSPFDATNPHTFVGSIVATLLPLQSKSNPLTTLGQFFSASLRDIMPTSSALSQNDYAQSLNVCQDQDAIESGYAVDPFCNVIRGIPPQYLNKDSDAVIDSLIARGYLDSTTDEPTSTYTDFQNLCITNETPLGYSDPSTGFDAAQASECVIKSQDTADLYLYYMDTRIEAGMSGEDVARAVQTSQNTGRPPEAIDRGGNGGWTLADNTDYSKYPCDPRTPFAQKYTSPSAGWTVNLCKMTFNTPDSADNGGNLVNSLISTNAMNMFEAAKAAGIDLGLSDGMRLVPPSYFSMHSTGLAMDLGTPRGGQTICYGGDPVNGYGNLANAEAACKARGGIHYAAYQWLRANAGNYGFFNYDKEPWHYSTSGTGV